MILADEEDTISRVIDAFADLNASDLLDHSLAAVCQHDVATNCQFGNILGIA